MNTQPPATKSDSSPPATSPQGPHCPQAAGTRQPAGVLHGGQPVLGKREVVLRLIEWCQDRTEG